MQAIKSIFRFRLNYMLLGILLSFAASAETQRFSLEKYEVADLKVWNVLRSEYSGKLVAYVMDPEGLIHHLEVGEKLGKHSGLVHRISKCTVHYTELVSDGKNGWQEVPRTLDVADCKEGTKQ